MEHVIVAQSSLLTRCMLNNLLNVNRPPEKTVPQDGSRWKSATKTAQKTTKKVQKIKSI